MTGPRATLAALGALAWVAAAHAEPMTVEASPIETFDADSRETRFGRLEFVGGLVLSGSDGRFEGLSGFRFTEDRERFLGITDTGFWYSGRLLRDDEGRPAGFADAAIAPLLGVDGAPLDGKTDADAESIALDGNRVLVGFERNHRILGYEAGPDVMESRPERLDLPVPRNELRINRGLEALAVSPEDSPLAGAAITIAEHSIDEKGDLFAAIFDGADNGVFKVKREEPWDVTDADFLPGGDLLILERRFSKLGGLGMRIRRIEGETIRPGALVDGPVLMEADLGQEIDNMEALDVSTGADGETYLTLVSDDNGSFFQRTLLLEFRLLEEAISSN